MIYECIHTMILHLVMRITLTSIIDGTHYTYSCSVHVHELNYYTTCIPYIDHHHRNYDDYYYYSYSDVRFFIIILLSFVYIFFEKLLTSHLHAYSIC